jgi:hypothetical protein
MGFSGRCLAYFLGMHKVLGSISSTEKKKRNFLNKKSNG